MPLSNTRVVNASTKETALEIQPSLVSLSSAEFGWKGILVERLAPAPIEFDDCPEWFMPEYSLAVQLSAPQEIIWKHATGQRKGMLGPGAVNLFSASEPRRSSLSDGYEVMVVCLEPAFVQQVSTRSSSHAPAELTGGFGFHDPLIAHMCSAFLMEIAAGCPSGRLFGEYLASALTVHLMTQYAVHPAKIREYSRGLSKSDLSRVLSYINDQLADDLSLEELANCVSLSPYHFCRLFKQSTGQSPHKYVITQRVEKAKSLLLRGGLTMGEVAQVVGFSDHSKFHHHFKKLTGLTPRQYSRR